jgi:hypothetical protein
MGLNTKNNHAGECQQWDTDWLIDWLIDWTVYWSVMKLLLDSVLQYGAMKKYWPSMGISGKFIGWTVISDGIIIGFSLVLDSEIIEETQVKAEALSESSIYQLSLEF